MAITSHEQYVSLLQNLGRDAIQRPAAYPEGNAFTFHTVEDDKVTAPITWENLERANVERIVQLRAARPGEFRVYLGRDAASAYAADLYLGGGNDSTLVNIGRVNRDKPGIKEYIDRTIVKAAKGRPIVIIDTSASGETYNDFILPNIPEAVRPTVSLDLGLQMKPRTARETPLPELPQSHAFLYYLTPERNQILIPKRKGTYQKLEKEFPHATARSRGFVEVPGVGMDAAVRTTGSNSSGTEDGSVDFDKNTEVMRAMAYHLSSPQIRAQADQKVALLQEIYDFAQVNKNPREVIRRFEVLQHLFEGEALRGMQAHFRDIVDRLETSPAFRHGRTGVLFDEALLKRVGLQYPFKPGRVEETRKAIMLSDLGVVLAESTVHSTQLKRSVIQFTIEKYRPESSTLAMILEATKKTNEPALLREVQKYLGEWRIRNVSDWSKVESVLRNRLGEDDAKSAQILYSVLNRNRQNFKRYFDDLGAAVARNPTWKEMLNGADLSAKPFSVNWHDGRPLSGISPDDLLK